MRAILDGLRNFEQGSDDEDDAWNELTPYSSCFRTTPAGARLIPYERKDIHCGPHVSCEFDTPVLEGPYFTHREEESEVSLRNLISAPTRQRRELATSIPAPFQTEHQGRRHVCCVRCQSS
ncbi:hypothetical protein AVEN_98173-1 [Araneus ventricosus]|uniref:Uncharacterized protein n=1 Tax=Araneus ventricosus TaxID=182803 RepID=A0A4Y2T0V3_ARAVE|nr:hypothetical protein AVEN_98173-1 [Araneus ventricosus]